jgi:hypothetical protein
MSAEEFRVFHFTEEEFEKLSKLRAQRIALDQQRDRELRKEQRKTWAISDYEQEIGRLEGEIDKDWEISKAIAETYNRIAEDWHALFLVLLEFGIQIHERDGVFGWKEVGSDHNMGGQEGFVSRENAMSAAIVWLIQERGKL